MLWLATFGGGWCDWLSWLLMVMVLGVAGGGGWCGSMVAICSTAQALVNER